MSEKEYSFTDNNPGSKVSYYRLKMVDKDGQFSLSNIVPLKFNCLIKKTINIQPTKSTGLFNIHLSPGLENAKIKVFNSLGQNVINNLPGILSRTLNLSHHAAGVYLVQIIYNNNLIETRKIIIAR